MYVRFVAQRTSGGSGRREGIFHAAGRLWRSGALYYGDYHRYWEIRLWFDAHLPKPTRFARSSNPRAPRLAICWFKSAASVHIAHAHELRAILESYDIFVELIKSAKPGYVVYEDDYQVAARPFQDTRT